MTIHEYIYVDIERVRSYYAQLSKGLPTETVAQQEGETGAGGSAGLNLPLLGGVKAEGDVRYRRSSSETTSLHDHLVELFVQKLRDKNLIIEYPRNDSKWEINCFHDGMFVLVKGPIKILDYNFLIARLKNLSEVEDQVRKISNFQGNKQEETQNSKTNQGKKRPSRSRKKGRNTANTFDEKFIGALTAFVDQNFSDTMRTKVYPYPKNPDNHFVATATKEFFRISTPTLINMYGSLIDANWSCLLQVNTGKKPNGLELTTEVPQQYGSLEAIFEFIEGHLTQFSSLFQQINYPAVATTPIVIFREINN